MPQPAMDDKLPCRHFNQDALSHCSRKAALLRDLVFDRFDQFAIEYFELHVRNHVEIEGGLNEALTFCANFALHPEIVGLQRVILQEIFRFPELAASFYATGITRIAAGTIEMARDQMRNGFITIDGAMRWREFLLAWWCLHF